MAQIVSLKTLKALAKKPIAEAEGGSRFWKDIKAEHSSKLKAFMKDMKPSAALERAYEDLKYGFLRQHCPPIRFINEGTSRAAFALDGGQCLKLAVNDVGIGQNKAEMTNMHLAGDLDIFPRLYDWTTDNAAILVECITPTESQDDDWQIAEMLGIKTCPKYFSPIDQIGQIVEFIVNDIQLQPEESVEVVNEDTDEEVWREITGYVLKPKTVQQQILRNLVLYAIKHHDEFDSSDIGNWGNWGFAVRDGEICPIMLDAGFSKEVKDTWY